MPVTPSEVLTPFPSHVWANVSCSALHRSRRKPLSQRPELSLRPYHPEHAGLLLLGDSALSGLLSTWIRERSLEPPDPEMAMLEWDHSKFLFPWLCFFSLKFELFLSHKSSTILALCCYLFKTLILDHGVKEIHTKHQKTLFLVWSQPVANYSSIFSAEDITILLTEDRRGRPDGLTQIHQSLVKDSSILIKAISSCLISQGQWTTYALPIKHTHTHSFLFDPYQNTPFPAVLGGQQH